MNTRSTTPIPGGHGRTGLRRRLFAWLNARDRSAYDEMVAERKRALFSSLQGDVLEVGAGSGANLPYLAPAVHWIGLEPNLHMHGYLRQRAATLGREITILSTTIEQPNLPANSVDAVISTLTLCSVDDPEGAIRQIMRLLRPGGCFLFIEHVAGEEQSRLRRVQNWIQPVWSFVADGCHPNRETGKLIEEAGFARVEMERFRLPLGPAGPHIAGTAIKGG